MESSILQARIIVVSPDVPPRTSYETLSTGDRIEGRRWARYWSIRATSNYRKLKAVSRNDDGPPCFASFFKCQQFLTLQDRQRPTVTSNRMLLGQPAPSWIVSFLLVKLRCTANLIA